MPRVMTGQFPKSFASFRYFLIVSTGLAWPPVATPQQILQETSHALTHHVAGTRSALQGGLGVWAPPDVDRAVPPVAAGLSCSLPEVLQQASRGVKEFVDNLEKFTATEQIEQWELDGLGKVRKSQVLTVDYFASIGEVRPGTLSVEEARNGSTSPESLHAKYLALGLPAIALIFHPYYVDDFKMTCEGLGQWHGRPAWQVRFQQRPDRRSRIRAYRVGGYWVPVKVKGRAWIAADANQILSLQTNLVEPLPQIRLRSESLTIQYGPAKFRNRNLELWLPKSAEVYFDLQGRRYHHRHSFSNFLLFSVDTRQEIQPPKEP